MSAKKIHCAAIFSGRVQGVGFRYQTVQVAREFEVVGYVRNMADGRVQLKVEGEETEVEGFLAEVRRQLGGFIQDEEFRQSEDLAGYAGFVIR